EPKTQTNCGTAEVIRQFVTAHRNVRIQRMGEHVRHSQAVLVRVFRGNETRQEVSEDGVPVFVHQIAISKEVMNDSPNFEGSEDAVFGGRKTTRVVGVRLN